MVLYFPPSVCVHVTHGTWKMESKCEESERKFPFLGSNQGIDDGRRKNSVEGGKEKKRKEKKKRNEEKKEMRKKKRK